jgi:mannosyltransferase OCH1-like enzyme
MNFIICGAASDPPGIRLIWKEPMNALIVNNRLIKILGALVKGFAYFYHFLFPGKRFAIPPCSAPRQEAKNSQRIPRIIWQTNYTDKVTLPVYANYLFNRWISPTYEHRFVSTEGRAEFIKANYPQDVYERYMRIQIGAGQADFWRVLVLQKHGGVYLDIDAHTVTSLDNIIRPEDDEVFILVKALRLSNYFIASVPDNPNVNKVISRIMVNIDNDKANSIFEMTGPKVFRDVLDAKKVRTVFYRYISCQGSFTNEYFQYIDKPQGKWTKAKVAILRKR